MLITLLIAKKGRPKQIPASLAAGIPLLLATPEDGLADLFKAADIEGDEVQSWLESGGETLWHGPSE